MIPLHFSRELRAISLVLVITILTGCHPGNSSMQAPAPKGWDPMALEQAVEDWRVQANVPGVVVGISLPGRENILLASGKADVKGGVALQGNERFRIASITKTFIAAEILNQAAKGRVDLDDPLDTYLPETPHGDLVTVRQLLSHRSGYFDPVHDDPHFIPYVSNHLGQLWTWDEVLALAFQHNLQFQPGRAYQYSNTNYILLGKIIEQVTGEPLGNALTSDLLTPLHLEDTFYATPTLDTDPARLVHGYAIHPLNGEIVDTTSIPYKTVLSLSTDTMVSNAADLLKWSRALYGKESVVLGPAFQKEMLTFDSISNYGLGVFQFDTPIGTSFGHGGDTAGYLSQMEYIPSQDLSLVILANTDAPLVNLSELGDSLLVTMFGDSAESHIEELIADLHSDDPSTRKNAIVALGHGGTGDERIVMSLSEVLESDPVSENRKEAALALGLAGKNSAAAKQALTHALQDNDETVKEAAQLALTVLK